MKEIVRYSHCFVCGDKNEHGLQAKFYDVDGEAVTELVTDEIFAGYRGLYHGGITSTLLDEVMIKAILARGIMVVTAEMTVRFKQPIKTGEKLRLVGRVLNSRGRVYHTEGEAVGVGGTVYATATGTYIEAGDTLKATLAESISPD